MVLQSTRGKQVQMITKKTSLYPSTLMRKTEISHKTFTYQGEVISEKSTRTDNVKRRIGLAMGGMQKVTSIWKSKEITTETKIELYRVMILSIATYSSESWITQEER